MKVWGTVFGIILILVIVWSPALAVPKSDLIASYTGEPAPTKPMPTPSPPTFDVHPIGVWIYPHIPASYYEWSKFPPEPTSAQTFRDWTPRVFSDEEWEEAMAKFYEYMAKHDAIRVLA